MQSSQWMPVSTEKQWVMVLKVARGHSDKEIRKNCMRLSLFKMALKSLDVPKKFKISSFKKYNSLYIVNLLYFLIFSYMLTLCSFYYVVQK